MELIIDLQRILWHEIGHLCVDILDVESDKNFFIDDFWVSYYETAISDHKWGGGVKILPPIKYEVLVEDNNKTSFAILGIISGCMFQTIFLKEFLKESVEFKNCFCVQQKCAGQGDVISFFEITSKIRHKYGRKDNFIKFSEIELFEIYYQLIVRNQIFLERINSLVIKHSAMIFEKFKESKYEKEFHYHFKDNGLNCLVIEIHNIMLETSFLEAIIELKEKIKENMIS